MRIKTDVLSKCTCTVVFMLSSLFGAKTIFLEGRGFVVMINIAFVELPKGFIERDTRTRVSCLINTGISALEVHVMKLTVQKGKK